MMKNCDSFFIRTFLFWHVTLLASGYATMLISSVGVETAFGMQTESTNRGVIRTFEPLPASASRLPCVGLRLSAP